MAQPGMQNGMAYQQPMSEKGHAHAHGSNFGNKWSFGFWDCCSPFGLCCLAHWCPCVAFGKTYARDNGEGETNGCNGMCCLWLLAAHFGAHSCFQCIMRGKQREKYGIEGGACGDYMGSLCCPFCVITQGEKESIVRQTGMNPKTKQQYQPVGGMTYAA